MPHVAIGFGIGFGISLWFLGFRVSAGFPPRAGILKLFNSGARVSPPDFSEYQVPKSQIARGVPLRCVPLQVFQIIMSPHLKLQRVSPYVFSDSQVPNKSQGVSP